MTRDVNFTPADVAALERRHLHAMEEVARRVDAGLPAHHAVSRVREIAALRIAIRCGIPRGAKPDWFDIFDASDLVMPGLSRLNFAVMNWSGYRLTAGGTRTTTWYAPSEALTYKLLATDLKGVVVADLETPLDAFNIELPDDVIYQHDPRTGWHSIRTITVTRGDATEALRNVGHPAPPSPRLIIEVYGAPNGNSQNEYDDTWSFNSYDLGDPSAPLDSLVLETPTPIRARMGREGPATDLRMTLLKFVLNLCIYLGSHTDAALRHEKEVEALVGGKKRKNLRQSVRDKIARLESDRIFDVGTTVVIDDAIKQYVRTGEGTGTSLTYRTIVRGHWRNQAHGPARTLRRKTWIEPHVRGADLNTPIVGHTYVMTEKEEKHESAE